MKPFVTTVRAIGSEYAARTVRALVPTFGIGAVVVTGILVWLLHFSLWWLVLAVPVLVAIAAGIGLLLAATFVVRLATPRLSPSQQTATKDFVDKLQRVTESVGTPVFLVMFRVVRDVVRPRETGFISQLAHDSTSLHTDFLRLQELFR